jgi:2-hydroxychromene-2-carboxylate isomerase
VHTVRSIAWYFDFVSPYAYLCLKRLHELPNDVAIDYRPVLFAGLLAHWGQKGPAELVPKRRWTYRWCQWSAARLGVPFRFPAAHPFNPLHHLRLAIAAGGGAQAIERIFDAIWTSGADAGDPRRFAALADSLGVETAHLGDAETKDRLRRDTDAAAAAGVFGVPTFVAGGELFWGLESVDLLKAWLAEPTVLASAEMQRLEALPFGAARKGA